MREILFRGKREDTDEWIYGDLLTSTDIVNCTEIAENTGMGDRYDVIPETVGQYTGLHDKNGVKIFDGDIVEHTTFHDEKIRTGFIEYIERYGAFFIRGSGYSDNQMYAFCNFKVIGNIHDNPELLEGETE